MHCHALFSQIPNQRSLGIWEITQLSGNNSEYEMEQDFISQNHKFTKISSTLTFKNVTRNYTGFCTCTAVNEIFEKIERKDNSVDSNV